MEKTRYNRSKLLQILEQYLQIKRQEVTGEIIEGTDEPFLDDELGLSFYREQVIAIGNRDGETLADNQIQLDTRELVDIFNQLTQLIPDNDEEPDETIEPEEEIVE